MSNSLSEKEVSALEAIVRIHPNIGAILDESQIARILVRELTSFLKCDACAIILIQGDTFVMAAEKGFSGMFGQITCTEDLPAIKHLMTMKEPAIAPFNVHCQAAGNLPPGYVISSLISFPITVNNEVKGIVYLGSAQKDNFGKEDLEFAGLLATEVSLVFEKSLLLSHMMDLSIRDGLTGCYNRRKFDLDIAAEFAQALHLNKSLSVLMVDIDWFKRYNDFHGHQTGDHLLKNLVTLLAKNIRPSDRIYRYGGEEFAVLLMDIGKVKAAYVAKRLQELVEKEQFDGEEKSQPNGMLTISVGVASFPADSTSWSYLIKAADMALYEAKQTGRNKVCLCNKKRE